MTSIGKRFYGKYAGRVFDNVDPKKLGRIRAIVPEVGFVNDATDWAFPCSQYGGLTDAGFFVVPDKGMNVWIEFEAGDANRPIWVGTFWAEPEGKAESPILARGGKDDITQEKGTDQATEANGTEQNEPPPAYGGKYPYNKVWKTTAGHVIEVDDTPNQERLQVMHRTGTYVEFKREGSLTQKVIGRHHHIVQGDDIKHVGQNQIAVIEKNVRETIKGDLDIVVQGNVTETYEKNLTRVYKGTYTEEIEGQKETIYSGEHIMVVSAGYTQQIGGSLTQSVGGSVSRMIVATSSEQVGNTGVASIGKKLDVLLGDYKITLVEGNEEHVLTLGDLVNNLTAGNWQSDLTLGDWIVNQLLGDLLFTLTNGDVKIKALTPLSEFHFQSGVTPLTQVDGVVTGKSIDPFLGSPHPDHSVVVLASHLGTP